MSRCLRPVCIERRLMAHSFYKSLDPDFELKAQMLSLNFKIQEKLMEIYGGNGTRFEVDDIPIITPNPPDPNLNIFEHSEDEYFTKVRDYVRMELQAYYSFLQPYANSESWKVTIEPGFRFNISSSGSGGDEGEGYLLERVERDPHEETEKTRRALMEFHLELERKGLFPLAFAEMELLEPQLVAPAKKMDLARLEILRCAVCYSTCFSKATHCVNQHYLCGGCTEVLIYRPKWLSTTYTFETLPSCPVCRSEEIGLNCGIKETLKRIEFTCAYLANGCNWIGNGLEAEEHGLHSCIKRSWKCFFCPTFQTLDTIGLHLIEAHGEEYCSFARIICGNGEAEELSFPIVWRGQPASFGLIYVQHLKKLFVVFQIEAEIGQKMMWFVCLVGTKDESDRYFATYKMNIDVHRGSEPFPFENANLTSKITVDSGEPKCLWVTSIQSEFRHLIVEAGKLGSRIPKLVLGQSDPSLPLNLYRYLKLLGTMSIQIQMSNLSQIKDD